MALKNYPFPEGTDLYAVIQATALAMDAQGYQTNIQMIGPSAGVLTVTKNREGFSNIIGLGLECRVNFSAINGQLTVNIDSEWTNKIIAMVVGWFLCLIPFITGIVGAVGQNGMPGQIETAIMMAVNNPGGPGMGMPPQGGMGMPPQGFPQQNAMPGQPPMNANNTPPQANQFNGEVPPQNF